jgi:energy-coupling factor transporter ATP-binding protein EcfA2
LIFAYDYALLLNAGARFCSADNSLLSLGSNGGVAMSKSNMDIFDFSFSNRIEEKKAFNNYVQCDNKEVLWITGDRGSGKTYFIKECLRIYCHDKTVIYVDAENNTSSSEYIGSLLRSIENAANMKFWEFLKTNYSSVIDFAQKTIEIAIEKSPLTDYGLVGASFNIAREYVDKRKNHQNITTVIRNYIDYIVNKKGSLVIVLDNLTRCDHASFDVLKGLFNTNEPLTKALFIVCTTTEDFDKCPELKSFLISSINHCRIVIRPFDNHIYFKDILKKSFNLDLLPKEELENLYKVCEGKPQKLVEFLQTLYYEDGMMASDNNKMNFVAEQFNSILAKKSISFDFNKMSYDEKTVIDILTVWGRSMPYNMLADFIGDLISVDFSVSMLQSKLAITIMNLETVSIVTREYINGIACVGLSHDNYYINFKRVMNPVTFGFLSSHIFRFLKLLKAKDNPNSQANLYLQANFDYLYALHAWNAKEQGWERINYQYAAYLHEQCSHYEAYIIFKRLCVVIHDMGIQERIIYSKNMLQNGMYKESHEICQKYSRTVNSIC